MMSTLWLVYIQQYKIVFELFPQIWTEWMNTKMDRSTLITNGGVFRLGLVTFQPRFSVCPSTKVMELSKMTTALIFYARELITYESINIWLHLLPFIVIGCWMSEEAEKTSEFTFMSVPATCV